MVVKTLRLDVCTGANILISTDNAAPVYAPDIRLARDATLGDIAEVPGGLRLTIRYKSKTIQTSSQVIALFVPALPGSLLCHQAAWRDALRLVPAAPNAPTFLLIGGRSRTPRELMLHFTICPVAPPSPRSVWASTPSRSKAPGRTPWCMPISLAYVLQLASSVLALCFGSDRGVVQAPPSDEHHTAIEEMD